MYNSGKMTLEERWSAFGKFYGYPECCVEWFIKRKSLRLTKQQERIHGGNGFIPCPSCAKKITEETINQLITNRICSRDYPNEEVDVKEVNRFLRTQKGYQ